MPEDQDADRCDDLGVTSITGLPRPEVREARRIEREIARLERDLARVERADDSSKGECHE